jgi:hypothetical protein
MSKNLVKKKLGKNKLFNQEDNLVFIVGLFNRIVLGVPRSSAW